MSECLGIRKCRHCGQRYLAKPDYEEFCPTCMDKDSCREIDLDETRRELDEIDAERERGEREHERRDDGGR